MRASSFWSSTTSACPGRIRRARHHRFVHQSARSRGPSLLRADRRRRVSAHVLIRAMAPRSSSSVRQARMARRGVDLARCSPAMIFHRHRARRHGRCAVRPVQYERLAQVTRALKARYPIADIVGHSDVAAGARPIPAPISTGPLSSAVSRLNLLFSRIVTPAGGTMAAPGVESRNMIRCAMALPDRLAAIGLGIPFKRAGTD